MIFHIDELRTSRRCYKCGEANQFHRSHLFPTGHVSKSFNILECSPCEIAIDRDVNAAKNILHLLYNYIKNIERPTWITR